MTLHCWNSTEGGQAASQENDPDFSSAGTAEAARLLIWTTSLTLVTSWCVGTSAAAGVLTYLPRQSIEAHQQKT